MRRDIRHAINCDWHMDQYDSDCTCGAVERYNMAKAKVSSDPTEVLPSVTTMLEAAQDVRNAVRDLNKALAKAHALKIKASVVRETFPNTYPPSPPKAPVFKVKSLVIDL